MSFGLTILGLIVAPLAAGMLAFVACRIARALTIAVALLEILSAWQLYDLVAHEGPLRYPVGGWGAPLGIALYADVLSALMVGMTAIVSTGIALYATAYFGPAQCDAQSARQDLFWPLILFLWASINALFLSGDIFNLYVTLELLTLAAVSLIGLAGTVEALAAALRYLLLAVTASLFFLLGVALLYSVYGTVDWELLSSRFQSDLPSRCAIVLITVGLLLKTALVPLHFWLPPAHASAPAPASALLSSLVLKAPFYVLLRLWFGMFPHADIQMAGNLLGALGGVAIVWGALQAIRQPHLKLLVAYSTVSQIGYLFLVFALTSQSTAARSAWSAVALFAVAHAFAKAAAFLAAGSLQYAIGSDRIDQLAGASQEQPITIFAFALAGVGLIGLPPSGAFLAKWLLLNSAMKSGQWPIALVILTGSVLAAVYVFRVVAQAFLTTTQQPTRPVPWLMQWVPLALAMLSLALGVIAQQPLALLDVGAPFAPLSPASTP